MIDRWSRFDSQDSLEYAVYKVTNSPQASQNGVLCCVHILG